uniref:CARD domain-containing protein n=1 Tax=Sander lucioperca TaxID=283035 RepID=A0A8D0CW54_SANLU
IEAIPAEKKLFKVRKGFVEGVSDANLNQLLDKLLHVGVINDEEMQSVNTKTRADKARDLIDTVRRKGNKASLLLMDTLHNTFKGPTLQNKYYCF